jgi:hypothetical protein
VKYIITTYCTVYIQQILNKYRQENHKSTSTHIGIQLYVDEMVDLNSNVLEIGFLLAHRDGLLKPSTLMSL